MESTPTETALTPVENVDKTWTFDYQGASGTFKLSSDQTSDALTALESARRIRQRHHLHVRPRRARQHERQHVRSTCTASPSSPRTGSRSTPPACRTCSLSWRDAAGNDVDKYNAIVDVSNEYGQFDLQPGAKGTAVVAFQQPITSAWRVTVAPAGGSEQVEAVAK